jgi:hypothetical protein
MREAPRKDSRCRSPLDTRLALRRPGRTQLAADLGDRLATLHNITDRDPDALPLETGEHHITLATEVEDNATALQVRGVVGTDRQVGQGCRRDR